MIMYRPIRELLAEAMEEYQEFSSEEEMFAHIRKTWEKGTLKVEPYSETPDDRINWPRTDAVVHVYPEGTTPHIVAFCCEVKKQCLIQ